MKKKWELHVCGMRTIQFKKCDVYTTSTYMFAFVYEEEPVHAVLDVYSESTYCWFRFPMAIRAEVIHVVRLRALSFQFIQKTSSLCGFYECMTRHVLYTDDDMWGSCVSRMPMNGAVSCYLFAVWPWTKHEWYTNFIDKWNEWMTTHTLLNGKKKMYCFWSEDKLTVNQSIGLI